MLGYFAFLGEQLQKDPKLLVALLVPLGHYAWNRYNLRNRKRTLRRQIAEFVGQRESLAKVAGLTHGESILQDLEDDLKAAMAELAPVSTSPDSSSGLQLRPALARWFLLYKPPGVLAWPLHILFYLNMVFVLMGIILSLETPRDPYGWLTCGLFLIPAYFLHWLARRRFKAQDELPASS